MKKRAITPIILCGGSGTRLWPLSTPRRPKQFLELLTDRSMVALTRERVSGQTGMALFEQPMAVGSLGHANLLKAQLPNVSIVLEPFGRNSAPAVAAACVCNEPDDILLILPADQSIEDIEAFHEAVDRGLPLAESDNIVTFGIEPEYPATGYGYIRAGAAQGWGLKVDAFVEKPDAKTAQSYLDEGGFFWNAGIFMFRVSTMIDALEQYEPEMLPIISRALSDPSDDVRLLDAETFATVHDISIDNAVMERARNVVTVPVSMGWNDVGGYKALHDLLSQDPSANVANGPVSVEASTASYVRSDGLPVLVSGVDGLAVVATEDAVMIAPKTDAAAVKAMSVRFDKDRDRLHVSDELSARADRFMTQAFSAWKDVAWDEEEGGFVEGLSLQGGADKDAVRRMRVQARQIFSFSKGAERGWVESEVARDLVESGVRYLLRPELRVDGGWGHTISRKGALIDETRDLYDHAFLILAGAAAWQAFRLPDARDLALEAFAFVNSKLLDSELGGWFEGVPVPAYRRSNPHMHMLEAALELYKTTDDCRALAAANKVVGLFESRFFRPGYDELVENFGADWMPKGAPGQAHIEPGHHYEWASLLTLHQRLTGHDTLSWQRRLIRRADACGLDDDGFAFNCVTAACKRVNGRKRLWPQLEMLRARLMHPSIGPKGASEKLFNAIEASYLNGCPQGLWVDEIDEAGRPVSEAVPASMLYHFVTSFGVLAREG